MSTFENTIMQMGHDYGKGNTMMKPLSRLVKSNWSIVGM